MKVRLEHCRKSNEQIIYNMYLLYSPRTKKIQMKKLKHSKKTRIVEERSRIYYTLQIIGIIEGEYDRLFKMSSKESYLLCPYPSAV